MKCSKCEKHIGAGDKFQSVTEGMMEEREQKDKKGNVLKSLAMQKTNTNFYCEAHKLK